MKPFETILSESGEVGSVAKISGSVVYVDGLPGVRQSELVVMETGEWGEALSLGDDFVEVLLFARSRLRVGTRVARTNTLMSIGIGDGILGKLVDPLGRVIGGSGDPYTIKEKRLIDLPPAGIEQRKPISEPFQTGVALVDLIIPLARGQRELVIGDRKIGKSTFVFQSVLSHVRRGGICVWASIAKRASDLGGLLDYLQRNKLLSSTVVVSTNSADAPGLVYLTPYSAMTVGEYFRDVGKDVLVVLDDLTIHAKYYRELALLAQRFPGRSAYPGDIFYLHSRLLERAGSFVNGTITCLPIAETVFGDVSGYVQTNLMSMTDGHIYFDQELYNQGQRPAVNAFVSVTRVGRQTQTSLLKSLSRDTSSFLVSHKRLQQLLHFGGELNEGIRKKLAVGDRINHLFSQTPDLVIPVNIAVLIIAALFAEGLGDITRIQMHELLEQLTNKYQEDDSYRSQIDQIVASKKEFSELVVAIDTYIGLLQASEFKAEDKTKIAPPREKVVSSEDSSEGVNNDGGNNA